MYNILIVVLTVLISPIISQDEDPICDNVNFKLITEFSYVNCDYTKEYFYFPDTTSCFPKCIKAVTSTQKQCSPRMPCPPSYKCGTSNKCELNEDSCWKYHMKVGPMDNQNKYLTATFKPTCTADGKWEAKQCKANGRCFCYDEVGKRIFGHEWSNKATNMTCACSRRRYEMENNPNTVDTFISLHCDSQGNFQKLQCNSGQCWCVNPQTGEMESTMVTEFMMKNLPCYSKADFSDKYLRQCDSHLYGRYTATKYLNMHGTEYANFGKVTCDGDGTYGSIKIAAGLKYCVWKDNKNIESFMASLGDKELYRTMNCNCARDKMIFKEAGLDMNLACLQNGNYKPEQITDETVYCVDDDGAQVGSLDPTEPCDEII